MNRDHEYQQQRNSFDVLHNLVEVFASKDWLNKSLRIRYRNKRYRISCNEEMFLAYQINDNCGLGPGVPGWPVCMIGKDYVYDEPGIPHLASTWLNMHDWLNVIIDQNFELI